MNATCDTKTCEELATRELRDDWGPVGSYCDACATRIRNPHPNGVVSYSRAEHHADLIAEREMLQAGKPVVNVQEEAE